MKKIALAPFAVASDGTVFANVAHVAGDGAMTKLIQQAERMDGVLFIGIAITRQQKKTLRLALDNVGAEVIARTLGHRQRHPARRSRSPSRRSR